MKFGKKYWFFAGLMAYVLSVSTLGAKKSWLDEATASERDPQAKRFIQEPKNTQTPYDLYAKNKGRWQSMVIDPQKRYAPEILIAKVDASNLRRLVHDLERFAPVFYPRGVTDLIIVIKPSRLPKKEGKHFDFEWTYLLEKLRVKTIELKDDSHGCVCDSEHIGPIRGAYWFRGSIKRVTW